MKKKVGNIIVFLFLLLVSSLLCASSEQAITLRMQDMNHEPINQAMCQAPFILEVELKNLEGYTDLHLLQAIPGIENFKSSRSMTSQNVSIDNGKKTVKVVNNFVLRADKKGTFTLGPIVLKNKQGQMIRSNRLIVYVGDKIIFTDEKQKDKYFMTMELDKKQAYIGEKVALTIKFFDRLFVDDLHLQFPEFQNMMILKNHHVPLQKSMIELNGQDYSVTEWNFDIYPTQVGSLLIQDIHAAFFAPELESKFKFGGAFDFFRSLHKSEQYIVANPIKLDVVPLPKSEKFTGVVAVGQFSKYVIKVNQDSAPVGQGVVLTAELFGDGNFEMIPSPEFILPEGFKYYDSNMVTIDQKRNYKRLEFIVQADIKGNYHIPEQLLPYFDPVDKKYKVLYSEGFDFTVTPALELTSASPASLIEQLEEFDDKQEFVRKKLEDFQVLDGGVVHGSEILMIPVGWYYMMLWLLLCIWLSLFCYDLIGKKYIFTHRLWKKYTIFAVAKKKYMQAAEQQSMVQLQEMFIYLFAQLIGVSSGQLHDVAMITYLKDKHFSSEQIQDWHRFYHKILHASFSAQNKQRNQDLFEQALQWIALLKEKS